ncbi:LacI family transcriptional regulator [[Clostridium] fimetarium]|uniref:LacI family transcriptional regulator n=2 Tax=[Clostridium] fimetarium TaxID=99656 RepID=A0A1I0M4F9_9FIRM|nr:LacI family transcriptional regulator [[Clostridium] fimetarium]
MCALLKNNETIASCYFADNDLIACGAMKAFKEYGYKIPQDISIIGFDNLPICNYSDPMLTTLKVSVNNMGQTAILRLVHIINCKVFDFFKIELAPELIVRNSVN